MSFVHNGGLMTQGQGLSEEKLNSSPTKPTFSKDLDFILDFNSENSKLDNFLKTDTKPKGISNPFDTGFWDSPDINKLLNHDKPTTIDICKIYGSEEDNKKDRNKKPDDTPKSIFENIKLNQGTGMVKGGSGRHKLDFCY